ncbi:MAG: putative glycolipid-binding domain-containing protein [bacterium]
MSEHSTILWRRVDMPGHEVAELTATTAGFRLSGVAAFAYENMPCRMEYVIRCDALWRTKSLHLQGHVGAALASLNLARSTDDSWMANDTPMPHLLGCVDVDLGFSPSTNLLPIRRLRLAVGAQASVRAAWVRFPELKLEVLEQTYAHTSELSYTYESAAGTFRRDLSTNASGFVVEYPDYWAAEAFVAHA